MCSLIWDYSEWFQGRYLMRFILQYCTDVMGMHKKTDKIDISAEVSTTDQILAALAKKFHRPAEQILVRHRRDNEVLRVVGGWDLDFYQIDDGAMLQLEFVRDEETALLSEALRSQKRKLLKVNTIEVAIEEADACEEEDGREQAGTFKVKKYLEGELDLALQAAREGNRELFQQIVQRVSDEADYEQEYEIRATKRGFILNQLGSRGWSVLHQTVYSNQLDFLFYLLSLHVNVNTKTSYAETAISIASKRGHSDIVQVLACYDRLNINEVGPQGTALHLAAKGGHLETVAVLLAEGADRSIPDNKGFLPIQICKDEACRIALSTISTGPAKIQPSPIIKLPVIVRGTVLKQTFTYQFKERFMVLNPCEGTLIRFETEKDWPLRPKEVIALDTIERAQETAGSSSIFQKKKLFHFQLLCQKKLTFASKHEALAKVWVHFINLSLELHGPKKYVESELTTFLIEQESGDKIEKPPLKKQKSHKTLLKQRIAKLRVESMPNSPRKATKKMTKRNNDSQSDYKNSTTTGISQGKEAREELIQSVPVIPSSTQSLVQPDVKRKTPAKFSSFELIKQLGKGAYGRVFLVRHRESGQQFAMKALQKRTLHKKHQLKYAVTECNILKQVDHPMLIRLHFSFQTPNYLYMVLDYCDKGDISYFLAKKGTFKEEEARFYIGQLVLAIEYLHSRNIIYRDLKPQNLLVDSEGHLRLADFGLSKQNVKNEDKTQSFCGTPLYLSPDMLSRKGVGKEADNYGIGCILYQFLHGESPFFSQNEEQLQQNIKSSKLRFSKGISETAKSLIAGLLERNPKKRLGTKSKDEIKNHLFFKGLDWQRLAQRKLQAPFRLEQVEQEEQRPKKVKFTDFDYDLQNGKINRVLNYSFVR